MKSDFDVQAAYLLFVEKDWKPSEYFSMKAGERLITRVFLNEEIDSERKRQKEIERSYK